MSDTLERADVAALPADAHRLLDALQALDLELATDGEVVSAVRSFEGLRRRLETVDHALIGAVEARGIPGTALARATGHWLRDTLHVDIHEANARVRAARAAGVRRTLTGEPLPPVHPVVAAGQAAGAVSARQAWVITSMLDKLPGEVQCHAPEAEQRLVGFCATLEPVGLSQAAARERDYLDQDGGYRDVERRRRDRDFQLTQRPDGSVSFRGEGTAEFGEFLNVTFDALAAPKPEADGVKDPRTPGQRRHDALLDALKTLTGSGSLPSTGGVMASVVLTMTAEAYATGDGFALTGHNALVPVKEALSWAGGDYRLMITALNSLKAVVAYSSSHRFFTEGQRLALIARDGGCSFPGCEAPPGWCQTHHVTESQDDGPTTIPNGTLLCGFHHREFERRGWHVHMEHGRPVWTPPRIVDPDQTPIRT